MANRIRIISGGWSRQAQLKDHFFAREVQL
jgi:hypothetical protein